MIASDLESAEKYFQNLCEEVNKPIECYQQLQLLTAKEASIFSQIGFIVFIFIILLGLLYFLKEIIIAKINSDF